MKVTYDIEDGKNIEVKTYDANGTKIYYKGADGFEDWKEYDANGFLIHYKNSMGSEKWYEYDNEKMIYFKDNEGHEWFADGYEQRKEWKLLTKLKTERRLRSIPMMMDL